MFGELLAITSQAHAQQTQVPIRGGVGNIFWGQDRQKRLKMPKRRQGVIPNVMNVRTRLLDPLQGAKFRENRVQGADQLQSTQTGGRLGSFQDAEEFIT